MKSLIYLFLFSASVCHADFKICPQEVVKQPAYKQAIQFLSQFEKQLTVGSCTIEIHTCDLNSSTSNDLPQDSIAGDIYIVDKDHREFYVPLFFPVENSSNNKIYLDTESGYLKYFYTDKNMDAVNGQKEKLGIEVYLDEKSEKINYIKASKYTSEEHKHILGIPVPEYIWCW